MTMADDRARTSSNTDKPVAPVSNRCETQVTNLCHRFWDRRLAAIMVVCILLGSNAAADSRSQVEEVLAAWKRARSEVRDLTAEFVRAQQTQLMRKPIVSTGEFLWASCGFRWRTLEPEPSDMVIVGRVVEVYYPDLKTVERYRLNEADMILTSLPGLTMSVEDLRVNYDIQVDKEASAEKPGSPPSPSKKNSSSEARATDNHDEIVLKLIPRSVRLKQFVHSIRIWARGARFQPRRVEYVEAEGDVVAITLAKVRTNTGLAGEDFKLNLPKDVEIVEPLEDLE